MLNFYKTVSQLQVYSRNLYKIILLKPTVMNLKRVFGAILTVLGIISLIYAAYIFAGNSLGEQSIKNASIYAVLGLIFFISGIGLVKRTKDES